MLRRADDMCRRRLAREHAGGKRIANRTADARFAVVEPPRRGRPARARRARAAAPGGVRRPARARARAARALPGRGARATSPQFGDRPGRAADLGWRTQLADARRRPRRPTPASRSSFPTAAASCACSSSAAAAAARRCSTRSSCASRSCAPRSGRPTQLDDRRRRPHRAGARVTHVPDLARERAEAPRVDRRARRSSIAALAADGRPRAGADCTAALHRRAASARLIDDGTMKRDSVRRHRLDHADELRRLRPCPRRFLNRAAARRSRERRRRRPTTQGLLVARHAAAHPRDADRATTTRTSPTCSPATAPTSEARAPARRAPRAAGARRRGAGGAAHEHDARALPPATRADVHGDRAHRRDLGPRRPARRPRLQDRAALARRGLPTFRPRRCRRSCSTPAARQRGLRLRLRYEYLQPEIDEDPEPWDPDDDDLQAVEEELRAAVERMWDLDDWDGVAETDVCGRCRYRSICRDSAAPGEPTWPVLSTPEL